ncbi:MAG: hypothetical protein ABSE58_08865 [Candidatus Limnocylindrales bacterium]|jgi:hypothetical protein
MEAKDRFGNLFFIGVAFVAWVAVAQIVTSTYPRENPTNGLVGAGMIGLACGLTAVPLFWLVPFARHRRIALLGDWGRAVRRGAWVAAVIALFVALRIQAVLSLPIAVFVVVLVLMAEMTLSMER